MKIYDGERYRNLTPTEYFRLMGFTDADVELLMANGISKTQLYKMAGNSIVVNVLEHLFKQLYPQDRVTELKNKSLKASNFTCEGIAGGVKWTGVRDKGQSIPHEMKTRWVREL